MIHPRVCILGTTLALTLGVAVAIPALASTPAVYAASATHAISVDPPVAEAGDEVTAQVQFGIKTETDLVRVWGSVTSTADYAFTDNMGPWTSAWLGPGMNQTFDFTSIAVDGPTTWKSTIQSCRFYGAPPGCTIAGAQVVGATQWGMPPPPEALGCGPRGLLCGQLPAQGARRAGVR
ncbi:MAG: hypothetical protein ACYDAQ_14385 [Mycobacteriales bacterium]